MKVMISQQMPLSGLTIQFTDRKHRLERSGKSYRFEDRTGPQTVCLCLV